MASEKALALVIRTSDWSETSRIATMWTREFGKVRVLAKGGRRLRSNFEVALDLLTVCSIVLLRKNTSGLELLTEARVEERFPGLRENLKSLYGGYYIAELLSDGTQDHDPHPTLFDSALEALRALNRKDSDSDAVIGWFEMAWLREIGYRPRLDGCAVCGATEMVEHAARFAFGPQVGGLICPVCEPGQRERRSISRPVLEWLRKCNQEGASIPETPEALKPELRQLLDYYVSFVLGKRPRLAAYLS